MNCLAVRHNFETAHRLPHLGGKCANLHGHSWWVEVRVCAPRLGPGGVLVEFAELKAALRGWVDTHLDHGAMLGADDPLLPLLTDLGCKVFPFGVPQRQEAADLAWPTVENTAMLLGGVARALLAGVDAVPGAYVAQVKVTETAVNEAIWGG